MANQEKINNINIKIQYRLNIINSPKSTNKQVFVATTEQMKLEALKIQLAAQA